MGMDMIEGELLDRFEKGRCSADEKEKVISWFVEKKYDSTLKFLWAGQFNKALDRAVPEEDPKAMQSLLDRVHHKMNIRSYRQKARFSSRRLFLRIAKVAAVILFPLVLIAGWYFFKSAVHQDAAGFAELVAPRGARIHFTLSDGTQGWLNSESTLRYPLVFSGRKRIVVLEGEGYFDVFKDARHPFIVKAGKLDVKAMGTCFDVNAYTNDDVVEITLISGKIEIARGINKKHTMVLTDLIPGQQVKVRKADYRFRKISVEDPECYAAWREGKLIFRNESMDQVVKKLGRWYNVKIYLQEKNLEDYRYHATFQYESLDEVLKLIKLSSPVDYKIIKRKKLPDGRFSKKRIILYAKNIKLQPEKIQ